MSRPLILLAIGFLAKVLGLPHGAPPKTCLDLMPRHPDTFLQSSNPPYQVLPAAGQGRVRLILGSPQGLPYQGFLILARDIETDDYVGEFMNLPDSAKIVECSEGVKVLSDIISISSLENNFNSFRNQNFEWLCE